jgi:hypothetical protein
MKFSLKKFLGLNMNKKEYWDSFENIEEYERIIDLESYEDLFTDPKFVSDNKKEVLKNILDIRKFEIQLYWDRSKYAYTFIAAVLAVYFVIAQTPGNEKLLYLTTCLGLIFSFAWYNLNRGSKYWQRNWETHQDVMEKLVFGPLYKTTLNKTTIRNNKFRTFLDEYPFSPTKINHLLNVIIIVMWFIILIDLLIRLSWKFTLQSFFYTSIGILTSYAIWSLYKKCKTGKSETYDNYTIIDFQKRGLKKSK